MNNQNTKDLLKQIDDGLQHLMEISRPLCENNDSYVSYIASSINNTSFELKKAIQLLKSQLNS